MNIGTWPLSTRDLNTAQLQCREATAEENQRLFWTKAVLQATPYEEKRYRQIAANASERLLQGESENGSFKATGLVRLPSTVAVSFSETSTRPSAGSNHRSTPPTTPLRSDMKKKSSHSRFSCYVKSHQTSKDGSKKGNQKRVMPSSELRSQNNNHHCDDDHRLSIASPKKILKLTQHCRANLCNSCSKLIQTNVTQLSSTLLCRTCLDLIRSSNQLISIKPVGWSKADEKELRRIIEGVVEEFQDHFGHALNLSIKQMSQHVVSNISLLSSHYQEEFALLTKKYRLTFLERFVQLMNKCQTKSNSSIQAMKPFVSYRVMPTE